MMRPACLALGLILILPTAAMAAIKPCAELEAEIAAKLEAAGVRGYELTTLPADKVPAGAKVVGTCEGGAKRITYEQRK